MRPKGLSRARWLPVLELVAEPEDFGSRSATLDAEGQSDRIAARYRPLRSE